ncbi:meiotic cell cortex C-terminal pleckstrin homology-domain-containing protein [Dissophora ornata]|nr:meiotic cell cortex C-terminal pleckstrin homology-domain-containing protein [Dissophora ornata]
MPSAASVNDASFPIQIQEELLNQVRYWTSQAEMKEKLNTEYDTKITEQERIIDALNKQRRLREESEERQKEDQWNLELQNQELRNQNSELQAQLTKANYENAKVQKAFATATEQVEQLKEKEEKTADQLELTKTKFEQDMTATRKQMAGIQREKSDLLAKVEDLNATMVIQQQKLSKKATLEAIAQAQELEEKEKEKENTAAPPVLIVSPARTLSTEESATTVAVAAIVAPVTEPKIASLARETSFAHQQSIISELQTKLTKEITEKEELLNVKEELLEEKEELVKMLADREETIETMRLEGVAAFEPDSHSNRSSMALLGGVGSRHPSEMGLLDETEATDPQDLSMTMPDSGSREFNSGQASPFPAGGLFAELAQATSHSNMKPPAEYRDQEVMTEPIESWIHTVPGISDLLNSASASQPLPETSTAETAPAANQVEASEHGAADVETIEGKPGTETKPIAALDSIATSPEVEALGIAAATETMQNNSSEAGDDQALSNDSSMDEPVPRIKSGVAVDEERRHTCDMSQSLEEPSTSAIPPVPQIHKELSTEHPASGDAEDKEFRVSFGSAFGGDPSATDTGRIRSVYTDSSLTDDQRAEAVEPIAEEPEDETVAGAVAVAAAAAAASKVGKQKATSTSEGVASSTVATRDQNGQVAADEFANQKENKQNNSSSTPEDEDQEVVVPSTSQQPARPAGTTVVSVTSHSTYLYDQNSSQVQVSHPNSNTHYHHAITDSTGATIDHQPNYRGSPNGSISSMSTDYNHGGHYRNGRRMSGSSNYDATPTDPTMIQLITQTMIGDYLWKYTRKRMAMGEKSHRRYVWVHPYTKTLYWSLANPGAEGSREQRAKSAFIVAVYPVIDDNPSSQNSDLPNVSLVIQTTNRNLKLRAPTREKHELWLQSISYLLSRPTTPGGDISSDNQTWTEVQANNNGRGASTPALVTNDAVSNLRQSERANNSLRKKGSMTRLQSIFGRNSGPASPVSNSVGSPRVGLSRLASSRSHSGITTTAAATNGVETGAEAGLENAGLANSD